MSQKQTTAVVGRTLSMAVHGRETGAEPSAMQTYSQWCNDGSDAAVTQGSHRSDAGGDRMTDAVVLPAIVDMVRKWAGEAGDMMDEGLYGVRFQFKRPDGGLAGTLSHGPKGAMVYMPGEKPLPVDEWLEKHAP